MVQNRPVKPTRKGVKRKPENRRDGVGPQRKHILNFKYHKKVLVDDSNFSMIAYTRAVEVQEKTTLDDGSEVFVKETVLTKDGQLKEVIKTRAIDAPNNCLFRTHQYSFSLSDIGKSNHEKQVKEKIKFKNERSGESKKPKNAVCKFCQVNAVRVQLLEFDEDEKVYIEKKHNDMHVINTTTVIDPTNLDYTVIVSWPPTKPINGSKIAFNSKYKFLITVYGSDGNSLIPYVMYRTNAFELVSKPSVWLERDDDEKYFPLIDMDEDTYEWTNMDGTPVNPVRKSLTGNELKKARRVNDEIDKFMDERLTKAEREHAKKIRQQRDEEREKRKGMTQEEKNQKHLLAEKKKAEKVKKRKEVAEKKQKNRTKKTSVDDDVELDTDIGLPEGFEFGDGEDFLVPVSRSKSASSRRSTVVDDEPEILETSPKSKSKSQRRSASQRQSQPKTSAKSKSKSQERSSSQTQSQPEFDINQLLFTDDEQLLDPNEFLDFFESNADEEDSPKSLVKKKSTGKPKTTGTKKSSGKTKSPTSSRKSVSEKKSAGTTKRSSITKTKTPRKKPSQ
jgi:hypothetical protein